MQEIIIRSLQGLATTAELEALGEWRRRSAENERQYRETEALWSVTADPGPSIGDRPSATEIIAAAQSRPSSTVSSHERRSQGRRRAAMVSLAVAALVLVTLVRSFPRNPPEDALTATEIITGPDELVTTRLSDGTTIRLAPRSRLLVRPVPGNREVGLDGQAFFAVAEDPDRPFTVRTRLGDAVVLGTRFDLLVEDGGVRVAVVEGRVALKAQGGEVEVAAGQVSRATEGSPPLVEDAPDLDPLLAWMDGFLVFQDTPLSVAAQEIQDHFGLRVLVRDAEVGRRTVSAWFSTETAPEVLDVVCRAAGAHCTVSDSLVSIEP